MSYAKLYISCCRKPEEYSNFYVHSCVHEKLSQIQIGMLLQKGISELEGRSCANMNFMVKNCTSVLLLIIASSFTISLRVNLTGQVQKTEKSLIWGPLPIPVSSVIIRINTQDAMT
jgi:hypothetical protein